MVASERLRGGSCPQHRGIAASAQIGGDLVVGECCSLETSLRSTGAIDGSATPTTSTANGVLVG
jgi:hypothetical protein